MIKVFDSDSFNLNEPAAKLIEIHSRGVDKGWMKKQAAMFTKEISELRPEKGHSYIHLISLGAGESIGCFPAGTPVRMADGSSKTIEAITLNDKVINRRGVEDQVITCYKRGYEGDMTEVDVAGMLNTIKATSNHKFYIIPSEQVSCSVDKEDHCKPETCRRNAMCTNRSCTRSHVRYFPEMREIGKLKVGDYVLQVIPDRGVGKQTWSWSNGFAKIFGYFLAEGSYLKSKTGKYKGIALSFGIQEEKTLAADAIRLAEELRKDEYKHLKICGPVLCVEKGTAVVTMRDENFATRIFKAAGEYSYGKALFGEVYSQSPEVLRRVLAGWIDGDGTCPSYERKNGYVEQRYTAGSVSKDLINDAQFLFSRLGVIGSVCLAQAPGVRDIKIGDRVSASTCRALYHYSFSNECGEVLRGLSIKHKSQPPAQKKQHSFIWNGFICRPIRSINTYRELLTVYNLETENDHTYLVYNGIAVSNCNRNGDYFNEKEADFRIPFPKDGKSHILKLAGGLKQYHPTFKKGHVFLNHANDNPDKSVGSIVHETYNELMKRGELIIKVPHGNTWDRDLHKLASGDSVFFSMATRVPFDYCSVCANRARTRSDYCDHLRDNMTMITKEGHQVFAINDRPDFFDISRVFRPADRTAWSLRKVAGVQIVGGAEMAESYGLVDSTNYVTRYCNIKQAIADKFAEMEKQIDLQPAKAKDLALACPTGSLSGKDAEHLSNESPEALRKLLAKAQVVLPLRDFVRVFGKGLDSRYSQEAEDALPGIFGRMGCGDALADEDSYSCSSSLPTSGLAESIVKSLIPGMSISSEPAQKRVRIMVVKSAGVVDMRERHPEPGPQARKIASEYAKYLVSFAKEAGLKDNEPALGLTLIRGYLKL